MKLPEVTHIQYLILSIIGGSEKPGAQIREELTTAGTKRTLPAFYQMMSRLEEARFVKGWYKTKVIDSQVVKERQYRLLAKGVRAFNSTRDFYLSRGVHGLTACREVIHG